jgi:hypothetical protein
LLLALNKGAQLEGLDFLPSPRRDKYVPPWLKTRGGPGVEEKDLYDKNSSLFDSSRNSLVLVLNH